ncbi:MAG TPA: biotin--[acetyl-CoA-carboxylase] ligase [Acidimicrobiales bacterium]|nr:biotin--[acetyl-CoA-carboxylase] ligase [Acidimicrobiales bacterium]
MNRIVWRVEHFEEIDSTNSWLVARAREGAAEGLVASAEFQTRGRGRLEREWVAAPGTSLLCSILLRPQVDASELQLSVASVALAARASLVRLCGVRPDLKWPNDLVVADAKIAGVLAEYVAGESPAVVVGIGVNLTPTGPDDNRATSVWQEAGVRVAPRALLDILLEELEPRRAKLDSAEGRAALREEYTRSLVTLGQRVRVHQLQGDSIGVATSVDEVGRLVVDVDGASRVFASGDIVHLRAEPTVES